MTATPATAGVFDSATDEQVATDHAPADPFVSYEREVFEEETVSGVGDDVADGAAPIHAPRQSVPRWLLVLFTVLILLVLSLILLWYYSFRPVTGATGAVTVANAYMEALEQHNITLPQQLATEGSRGVLPPTWFTIAEAQTPSSATATTIDAQTVAVPVEITLTPPTAATVAQPLGDEVYRTYTFTLVLKSEAQGWRVDQQQAFRALREEIRKQNPGIVLPAQ